MQRAVIFDLDGTLVDTSHLIHLLDPPRYDEFHRLAYYARPNPLIKEALQHWRGIVSDVLIVTARSNKYRQSTINWMKRHNVKYDLLVMRTEGDFREDHLVKKDMYEKLSSTYVIEMAYEDNAEVAQMYRDAGVTVHLV